MGCFPCDTRLEAFPPYLSRVSSLARLLFCRFLGKKIIYINKLSCDSDVGDGLVGRRFSTKEQGGQHFPGTA